MAKKLKRKKQPAKYISPRVVLNKKKVGRPPIPEDQKRHQYFVLLSPEARKYFLKIDRGYRSDFINECILFAVAADPTLLVRYIEASH